MILDLLFRKFIENKPDCRIGDFVERANKLILMRNLSTGEIQSSKPNFASVDPIFSPLDLENIDWATLENSIYKLCLEK